MTTLVKGLSVRLQTKWLWVRILVVVTKTSYMASFSSKEFLDIQATPDCRFTVKRVSGMIRTHNLLVTVAIFLSTFTYIHKFHVNFLLKRHLSRGHKTSCSAHHLERTDIKPFSGLIGPRHMITTWTVAHQSWLARCSPRVL